MGVVPCVLYSRAKVGLMCWHEFSGLRTFLIYTDWLLCLLASSASLVSLIFKLCLHVPGLYPFRKSYCSRAAQKKISVSGISALAQMSYRKKESVPVHKGKGPIGACAGVHLNSSIQWSAHATCGWKLSNFFTVYSIWCSLGGPCEALPPVHINIKPHDQHSVYIFNRTKNNWIWCLRHCQGIDVLAESCSRTKCILVVSRSFGDICPLSTVAFLLPLPSIT